MRKYQKIWDILKKQDPHTARFVGVSVSANPLLHPRIIKAVTKEKWKDLVYKLETEPRVSTLTSSISGNILTFTLDLSFQTGDF